MVRAGEIVRAADVVVQGCRLTHSTGQTIAHGTTPVTVAFDTEVFDYDGMHSNVTNNSRITVNTAGVYVVGFAGSLAADTDYTRVFGIIRVNGTIEIARTQLAGVQGGSFQQLISLQTVDQFDAGDYLEAQVIELETGAQSHSLEVIADRSPIFYAARIGPTP